MEVNKITITQADKYHTILYPHYCSNPKGSVVVLHGMAEHHDRYNEFAKYLCKQGYDVFLYDHRGHGLDKKIEELGLFAEHDGYKHVICDAIQVLRYVAENNRGEKLILFSHSMGSIIARNIIQYYDALDGVIICGTSYPPRAVLQLGLLYAGCKRRFKGYSSRLPKLAKLITGGKRYSRISNRTAYDWLSRDNTLVGAYIHDPYCGFLCTTAFYQDLLKLTALAASPKLIKRTRRDLPIFIISGSHDPVGNFGHDIARLFATYQRYMFSKVDCTIYDECRHELLNEINHAEIMKDISDWMDSLSKAEDGTQLHESAPAWATEKDESKSVDELVRDSMKALEPEETEGEKRLAEIREAKKAQWKSAHPGEDNAEDEGI